MPFYTHARPSLLATSSSQSRDLAHSTFGKGPIPSVNGTTRLFGGVCSGAELV